MLEKDMENLIAEYPEDFFPGRGFELKGRQKSFIGVGRFDLLFEDRFKTNVLMELKAVAAKYDDATQLARYRDELRFQCPGHILMWLVAPKVPGTVREFLDEIGIQYSEIHEAEFLHVAERHGVTLHKEAPPVHQPPNPKERRRMSGSASSSRGTVLRTARSREFIKPTIHQLWKIQGSMVLRDQLAGKLGEQVWVKEKLDAAGITENDERLRRIGNQVDFFSADYTKGLHGLQDEFVQDEVEGKKAYRPR